MSLSNHNFQVSYMSAL